MLTSSGARCLIYGPRREKTGFLHMRKTKTQISFAVTAKLISAFVFATRIVQSLYFLSTKFHASSHLLLYSLVCVGPGRKPRSPVFSERGSYGSAPCLPHFFMMRLRRLALTFAGRICKLELRHEKTYLCGFDKVQHSPDCAATENG